LAFDVDNLLEHCHHCIGTGILRKRHAGFQVLGKANRTRMLQFTPF